MAFSLAPVIKQQFFDDNGLPLAGGKIYSYQAGTTAPQATYTSSTGITANANPVILDASGRAAIWLNTDLSYKFLIKTSADVSVFNEDNIIGLSTNNSVATASIQDLAVTTAKIADNAVTSTKLASDPTIDLNRAVTANHLRNDSITTLKILDANVTRLKLATGAVAPLSTLIKAAAYTVLVTDDYVECDSSSLAFTLTLPLVSTCTGRVFTFIKTDTSFNQITITGSLLTCKLSTQGELLEIRSNGTSYYIVRRFIPSDWTAYTPTFQGFGTVTGIEIYRKRENSHELLRGKFTAGTATAVEARMSFFSTLVAASTAKIPSIQVAGFGTFDVVSPSTPVILVDAGNAYINFSLQSSSNAGLSKLNGNQFLGGGKLSFTAQIPIQGWES
jgi:hypothetical protein